MSDKKQSEENQDLEKLKNDLQPKSETQSEELVKSQQEDEVVEDFSKEVDNDQFQKDNAEFETAKEKPVYANSEAYGTTEKGETFAHIDEHNKAMLAYREKFGHDCDWNLTTKDINALINPVTKEDSSSGSQTEQEVPMDFEKPVTNEQWVPQPHEQRVVEEYQETFDRTQKLNDFINENPIFKNLSETEQLLLRMQLWHMQQYCGILSERIYLFQGADPNKQSVGMETIGTFGIDNEAVFALKYLSMMMIDATNVYGNDPRRNAIVRTDVEKTQMMAVKSIFSK